MNTRHIISTAAVSVRRRHFLHSMLAAAAALQGCASIGGTGTSSVVDSLTSQLGVTPQQASGGMGSMLNYAKGQLSPSEFSTVANALPGADSYMKVASDALGGGAINSASGLGSAFSKFGMSPDMVGKFTPIVADYAGKYGGSTAKTLVAGVFQ